MAMNPLPHRGPSSPTDLPPDDDLGVSDRPGTQHPKMRGKKVTLEFVVLVVGLALIVAVIVMA